MQRILPLFHVPPLLTFCPHTGQAAQGLLLESCDRELGQQDLWDLKPAKRSGDSDGVTISETSETDFSHSAVPFQSESESGVRRS